MEPLTIEIENFMSHRSSFIDCTQFSSAIIIGKSKNNEAISNGTGKSTIFHAINWVLFNEYPTKTVDKIIRNGADRCKVSLEFKTNSGIFKVIRSRGKKNGELLLFQKNGEEWESYGQKTNTEVEKELQNIIKISYNAFRNSVLFAQSDLNGLRGLASEKAGGRREILKAALDLVDYSKLEKISKEELSECAKKVNAQKAVISSLGDPSSDIEELKKNLSSAKENLSSKELERSKIQKLLDCKKENLVELQKTLNSEASSTQEKISEIRLSKRNLQSTLLKSESILKQKENELSLSVKKLNDNIVSLTTLNDKLETLKVKPLRALDEVRADFSKFQQYESDGIAYILSLEKQCEKLRKPMPDGQVCPHCRQPMSEEHKQQCLLQISEEIDRIEQEILSSKRKLEKVKFKKTSFEKELNDISLHEVSIKDVENKINNKKNEIQNCQNYITQLKELVSHFKNEVDLQVNSIKDLETRENSLKEITKKLNVDEISIKITKLKEEIESLESKSHQILKEISSLNVNIGMFSGNLDSRNKDKVKLSKLEEELKRLEKDHYIRQLVVQGFSNEGIPSMIIHTVLDDLQVESNKLLNELRPGLELNFSITKNKSSGEQEETLDIYYRVNGVETDYEQLSGGQKLMIALSLKLGLSLVIQHRLGVDIKFLELDEVDQSLDKAGVEALADVIKKWQDRFKIFLITHNDNLKHKLNHVILVENDGANGATAKVTNSW